MPVTYYVCLDTSVLVDFLKMIWKGKPPQTWTDFQKLIEDKNATLLVPEVTLLELEKHFHIWSDELSLATTALESQFPDDDLAELLRNWRNNKRQEHWEDVLKLRSWLELSGTKIQFTPEIAHRTKLRLIAGDYPANRRAKGQPKQNEEQERLTKGDEWLRDQDCAIIDSLIFLFNGYEPVAKPLEFEPKDTDKVLAFATTDKGFGPVNETTGIGSLHESFRRGLPPTQVFKNLGELTKFVTNQKKVTPITKDEAEEIERAEGLDELFDRAVKHGILVEKSQNVAKPAETAFPPGTMYPGYVRQGPLSPAHLPTFLRQDYERRMRNMQNYVPPPGFFDPICVVTLFERQQVEGMRHQAGYVTIYRKPVTQPEDYKCSPPDILTFEQVKSLSTQIEANVVVGTIGDYDWQL